MDYDGDPAHPALMDPCSGGYRLRARWWWARLIYFVIYATAGFGGLGLSSLVIKNLTTGGWVSDDQYLIGLGLPLIGLAIWALVQFQHAPTRWQCRGCGRSLNSNEPWICGSCDNENHPNGSFRTILRACRKCKTKPPSYVCHHCGELTPFWPHADPRHPARRLPEPLPGETEDQARSRREREIKEKQHEIERLKHDAEIRKLTLQADRSQPPAPVDQETVLEQQLERALNKLKIGMRAVAKSKQLQAQLDQEILANSPGLPAEEVERLRGYAKAQFDNYREDIRMGRYDQ